MIGKRVAPGRAEKSICILIGRSFDFMPVYPLEKKDAETAARVYSDLRKAGKKIGNQDVLIAGICTNPLDGFTLA